MILRRVAIVALGIVLFGQSLGIAQSYGPTITDVSRTVWTGNDFVQWDPSLRALYVAGVYETLLSIASELTGPVMEDAYTNQDAVAAANKYSDAATSVETLLGFSQTGQMFWRLTMGISRMPAYPTAVESMVVATVIVDDYINAHPSQLHQPAAILVWRALSETTWE